MLLPNENLPFHSLTEGDATILLMARNQELRHKCALKNGNASVAEKHLRIARHLRGFSSYNSVHTVREEVLNYPFQSSEQSAVNQFITNAKRNTQPSITFANKKAETNALQNLQNVLNGNRIDEFDPTPEQITQCRSEAYQKAFQELLKSARNFIQGTFDPGTQILHTRGNQLVVISKSDLATLEQKYFESCSSRVVYENIVNKKISQAGNLAIYSVMHNEGHQIEWNARVQARLYWQEQWVVTTAKVTGLSQQNIRLVLENSAINQNEETPSETIVKTGQMLIRPESEIPTTLPSLGGDNGGIGAEQTIEGLVIASIASGNFAAIVISVSILLLREILNAVAKRRAEAWKSLDDPEIIAARCADANIPLENCVGLPPDFVENSNTSNKTTGYLVAGGLLLGLVMIATKEDKKKKDIKEKAIA